MDILMPHVERGMRAFLGAEPHPALIITPLQIQELLTHVSWGEAGEPAPLGTIGGTLCEVDLIVIGCTGSPHVVPTDDEPMRCGLCGAVKRGGIWRAW